MLSTDTIVALSTPNGVGAIAVIRVSGPEAFTLVNRVFRGADLSQTETHTLHFGTLHNGNELIDEVVVAVFRGPKSYTKEDVIEISCHGSPYIVQRVIRLLLERGGRLAQPGEFTQRAFLNGRFDLVQAEAVADLIQSGTASAHQAALHQMRGGFSARIKELRGELVHFASMIELELDFGEEDVEFASREDLKNLVAQLQHTLGALMDSFAAGNAIKNGIPTVIAGKPNAGKSTLLNALLNEEKAIVSDIPGTTRDFIEDEIHLEGVTFRFIDTAGLRETMDAIESIGVQRTQAKMKEASLILYVSDLTNDRLEEVEEELKKLEELGVPYLAVGNKADAAGEEIREAFTRLPHAVVLSALTRKGLQQLQQKLVETVHVETFQTGDTLVTNLRHYESLRKTQQSLQRVLAGIDNQASNDLLTLDIREALDHLGEITGEITTDDLLEHIFSKFCIGK